MLLCLGEYARVVHHLFRDAAHVDARASDTPFCSSGRGLHKVSHCYFLA